MQPQGSSAADVVPLSPPPAKSPPSSPFLSPTRSSQSKEKRVPSVTPRRFRRFFTPRPFQPAQATRTILASMNPAAVNRQLLSPQSPAGDALGSDPICLSSPSERLGAINDDRDKRKSEGLSGPALSKRRRGVLLPDDAPQPLLRQSRGNENTSSSAVAEVLGESLGESLGERRNASLSHFFKASRKGVPSSRGKSLFSTQQILAADNKSSASLQGYQPQPVRKFRNRGFESHLLDREHGFSSHTGQQYLALPAPDPRAETAPFCSDSSDVYHCTPLDNDGTTIPFSLASCHTMPLTAIGDEQGYIRFFSTGKPSGDGGRVTSVVELHDNAVMDLDFSSDDSRLASACGNRSGRILDTQTQTIAVELGLDGAHFDSLRQVAFQPGEANGNVLATSDRASRVQIWDLRCCALPAQCFSTGPLGGARRDDRLDIAPARTVNTIDNAHERTVLGNTSAASVTAIQWLPPGREHLLLTASEANASIKLWDTRYIKPRRQLGEVPVAVTPSPSTHAWRSYGITSMALSTDASRLFAVCKDSTVYAYSVHHLMLGHAPELLPGAPKRRPAGAEGLGPLYGLKHDMFRVASFYVKCAIRPGRGGSTEMLAVGSSDSCAVLFPTDERYMRSAWARHEHVLDDPAAPSRPLTPLTPSTPFAATTSSSPPVCFFRSGTHLVRGHSREVTTLSWSCHGNLVTASDDYIVRQWKPDAGRARHLRQVGEFGGERYLAGWADVGDDWDCDEY